MPDGCMPSSGRGRFGREDVNGGWYAIRVAELAFTTVAATAEGDS